MWVWVMSVLGSFIVFQEYEYNVHRAIPCHQCSVVLCCLDGSGKAPS